MLERWSADEVSCVLNAQGSRGCISTSSRASKPRERKEQAFASTFLLSDD